MLFGPVTSLRSPFPDSFGSSQTEVLHSVVQPLLRSKYTNRMLHVMFCDPRRREDVQDDSVADAREAFASIKTCANESGGGIIFIAVRRLPPKQPQRPICF